MARFKDFGKGKAQVNAEPLVFKLYDEEFSALPAIQGSLLIDLVKDSSSDDASKSAEIITKFFDQVLLEESLTRFKALINSKDKIVDVETLAEITGWLVEEYTNRPEAPAGA